MTDLRRHALVWLKQSPWPERECDRCEVDRWHGQERPFVVCRQRGEQDRLSLGFCLASTESRIGKPHRFAVQALREHILRVENPPPLVEVARCGVSAAQADPLGKLAQETLDAGLDVRVFGSWMWQMLTGDPYVNASSDLDLLITVATKAEANRTVALLQGAAVEILFPLDGELSFPASGEVQWREYCGDAPMILLKSLTSVRMIRREELWK